jgi:hypothetical protein
LAQAALALVLLPAVADAAGRTDAPARPPIRLVLVGAADQAALGPLPWPRERMAALVSALDRAGAKAIVFRFYFRDKTDSRGDRALADAARRSGRTFVEIGRAEAPEGWTPDDAWLDAHALRADGPRPARLVSAPHVRAPYEALARAVAGVGSIDVVLGEGRRLSALPLVVSYRDRLLPSLALRVFLRTTGLEDAPLAFEGAEIRRYWFFRRLAASALKIGGARLALDEVGAVHVPLSPPGGRWPALSYQEALRDSAARSLRGAIVIAGAAAPELEIETATGSRHGAELVADQLAALYSYVFGGR